MFFTGAAHTEVFDDDAREMVVGAPTRTDYYRSTGKLVTGLGVIANELTVNYVVSILRG